MKRQIQRGSRKQGNTIICCSSLKLHMQSISICWGLEGCAFLECISAQMQIFSVQCFLAVSFKSTVLLPIVCIILPCTVTDVRCSKPVHVCTLIVMEYCNNIITSHNNLLGNFTWSENCIVNKTYNIWMAYSFTYWYLKIGNIKLFFWCSHFETLYRVVK